MFVVRRTVEKLIRAMLKKQHAGLAWQNGQPRRIGYRRCISLLQQWKKLVATIGLCVFRFVLSDADELHKLKSSRRQWLGFSET